MSTSSSAAARWLAVGRDVLLTGDVGSGKTWALREVAMTTVRRGEYTTLAIRAQHAPRPYGPLRSHDSAPRGELTERAWVAWMREELTGRRALLLVDDLDRVDEATAAVVRTVLGSDEVRMVATVGTDVRRLYASPAALLVAERAPARVRVEAMGLSETARMLGGVLGGPASIGVVSAVATRSAGNPRVALALADAARVTGVVRVEDGVWVKVGTMDSVPVDSVAHGLLPHVPPEELEALAVLADHGTLGESAAALVVGADVLAALVRRGRIVVHRQSGDRTEVAVSPPALGRALRSGALGPRTSSLHLQPGGRPGGRPGEQLGERPGERLGERSGEPEPTTAAERRDDLGRAAAEIRATTTMPTAADEYSRWAAEIAVLVHSRSQDEIARRRATWLLSPTVAHATQLLSVLLRHPVDAADVDTIFQATELADDDLEADRVYLEYIASRWETWSGRASAVPGDLGLVPLAIDRARRDLERAAVDAGSADVDRLGATAAAVAGAPVGAWAPVLQAGALLEAGRPDLALTVCEQAEGVPEQADQLWYLDGVHSEALLLLGRIDEAEHHARASFEAALGSLDGLGIRVNAGVLAVVLATQGRAEEAWRTLTVSLRLGSPGPLENTFYRRSLTVGTLLRSRIGDFELARALVAELDRTPTGYKPILRSMGVVARAALDTSGSSDEDLWSAGRRYADAGLLLPALWCWLAHSGPHSAERVREVRAVYDSSRLPLLGPLVRLHEALTAGDLEALDELVGPAATLVNESPRRTAWAMLGRDQAPAQGRRSGLSDAQAASPLLTTRERQIALLARDGLSNKEIAAEFTLSVRTVENHMSSLLHKLGFSSRQDLTLHMFV